MFVIHFIVLLNSTALEENIGKYLQVLKEGKDSLNRIYTHTYTKY